MTPLEFTLIAFGVSLGAGMFGAMLGLGGGIIIIPALTLLLHVDIRHAVGASIVSVIATSSAAGAAYIRQHLANLRLAMFLEVSTTLGALGGACIAGLVSDRWIYIIFACVLSYVAFNMWRRGRMESSKKQHPPVPEDALARRLRLEGEFYDAGLRQMVPYQAGRSVWGFMVSGLAGVMSGLLGVGGGIIKVPTMNLVMGLPLKVSTATSNFMIGVTAAASAGVYFARGDIVPIVSAPVAIGILVGATAGARLLPRIHTSILRTVFTFVLVIVAAQMLWKGVR